MQRFTKEQQTELILYARERFASLCYKFNIRNKEEIEDKMQDSYFLLLKMLERYRNLQSISDCKYLLAVYSRNLFLQQYDTNKKREKIKEDYIYICNQFNSSLFIKRKRERKK